MGVSRPAQGRTTLSALRESAIEFVGADARIGPLGSYEFAENFRENGASCRADEGIGPYAEIRECIRMCRSFS